jgi:hypothetical protein
MEQEEGSTSSEGRCNLYHIKVMQNTEWGRAIVEGQPFHFDST